MISVPLGSDVPLEFGVKVGKASVYVMSSKGELYKGDRSLGFFPTQSSGSKVRCAINGDMFASVGEYLAKFTVTLEGRGEQENAIPFKITESVLGKKRQLTGSN